MDILGSVAGAGLDLAFGGIKAKRQWKYKKKEMALQNEYALGQMEKQHEYQMDAWNKENEYNDPRNVRARYEAAGISPQAALGGAATGAGIAGSMATPGTPSGPGGGGDYSGGSGPTSKMDILGSVLQLKGFEADQELKKAQARNLDAQTETEHTKRELNKVESSYKTALAGLVSEQRLTQEQQTRAQKAVADFKEATLNSDIEAQKVALGIANETLKQAMFNTEHQHEKFSAEMKSLAASTFEMQMRAVLNQKQAEVANLSKREIVQRVRGLIADMKLTNQQYEQMKKEFAAKLPYLDEKSRAEVELLVMTAVKEQNIAMYYDGKNSRETASVVNDYLQTAIDAGCAVFSGGLSRIGSGRNSIGYE